MRRRARLLALGLIAAALAAAPAYTAGSPEQELANRSAPVLAFQKQKELRCCSSTCLQNQRRTSRDLQLAAVS